MASTGLTQRQRLAQQEAWTCEVVLTKRRGSGADMVRVISIEALSPRPGRTARFEGHAHGAERLVLR